MAIVSRPAASLEDISIVLKDWPQTIPDPTVYEVTAAFTTDYNVPQVDDDTQWYPATWESGAEQPTILVRGDTNRDFIPAIAVTYSVYVKVDTGREIPIIPAGQIRFS